MLAVIYDPKDGTISSLIEGTLALIQKNGSYIEVTEMRGDYDTHYRVVDGEVVAADQAYIDSRINPPPPPPHPDDETPQGS